ncbi:MAG: cupin domain-containing protein [Gemmatimonadetes bacterium]|nr:cupin domain-containing protein [Gemmatimonadota bacterium]
MYARKISTAITYWGLNSAIVVAGPATVAAQAPGSGAAAAAMPMFVKYGAVSWQRIFPDLGVRSPEISILRVDSASHATQLMIRVPRDFYVPKHWHGANETHTIVSGTFVMDSAGQRLELGPGSFNFMPAKMVHDAWTKPNDGAVLFITVDGPWDVNFVEGPPTGELASKRRSGRR